MTEEIEWVQIPGLKNYEVNKDGEVRNQDKKIKPWGRTFFLYGARNHPLRLSIFKIMRETFGDDSVDKSNAIRLD